MPTVMENGLLNGQPIGPELPPSVPCEVCGGPVWCTERVTVFRGDDPVEVRGVFEQTFPPPGPLGLPVYPWALVEHCCPVARGRPALAGPWR